MKVEINVYDYSLKVCPVCWRKKSGKTTYAHNSCWGKLNYTERGWLKSGVALRKGSIGIDRNWRRLLREKR
ncbi:hypothetical protein A2Z67_00120 [Candidatus Woesebacteria bacterium RBG_13_36_22]|uniref:Uncharacterized protein n=1 Tax=Candidatus Woesebacteria bacterium RBG_13_36_22 TaxID=1802478 RepID=A0A1F7X6D1_9BACT|nr:MAG: hypothetical protein A2Z67_00120 [Candidatus Woesebacteria bacterium RBG_13_36_22]